MKKSRALILFAVLTIAFASFASADQVNRDIDPTFTGESGLFTIYLGDTLPQGYFSFGLVYQNFDRETSDFDTNVFNIVFGYGITNNLEVAVSIAPITQVAYTNWALGETVNSHPFAIRTIEEGMGDMRIGLKYRLIDDKGGVAVAVRAFAKLPTADNLEGFGSGGTDFGGTLILSKIFSDAFEAAANLGYTFVGTPDEIAVGELSDELSWGAGFGLMLDKKMKLKFMGEVKGISYMNDDDFPQAAPLDIFVGFQKRFWIAPKYDLRLGVGYQTNVAFDTNVADDPHGAGVMITIGPSKNIPPVIREVKPERNANCVNTPLGIAVIATDENDDDLHYAWKVNGTAIDVTGSNIKWTPTAPGDYTITAIVCDGRYEGKVSQDINIKVYPAPTLQLSVNADKVYATKKYTVTAAITNPGDYPLTYNWSVDLGTIAAKTNKAEAVWDLSKASEGDATIKLQIKSEIGCDVVQELKVKVEKDPCLTITDEDIAGEVNFPLNKYELREPTEEAYKIFDRVIEKMKLCETIVIRFEGHCCILGTDNYNMCLGWWRTETVVKYFVEHGISRDRIKTISFGERNPKYENAREKTRQWNRRVMIKKDSGEAVPAGEEKDTFIEKCKKRYSRWLK